MAMIARDRLTGMSCADSLSPLNTPREAKTCPSPASTMSALGVGSIARPPLPAKVPMQEATYPTGRMMIEASAAITISTRRGWSATAEGQYLGTRRGRSCRGSEPSRDGVLIACNLSAEAADLPIRGDAEDQTGKSPSAREGPHYSGCVPHCLG